jgi:hypothetical protein
MVILSTRHRADFPLGRVWAEIVAAASAAKGLETAISPSKVSLSAKCRNVVAEYFRPAGNSQAAFLHWTFGKCWASLTLFPSFPGPTESIKRASGRRSNAARSGVESVARRTWAAAARHWRQRPSCRVTLDTDPCTQRLPVGGMRLRVQVDFYRAKELVGDVGVSSSRFFRA